MSWDQDDYHYRARYTLSRAERMNPEWDFEPDILPDWDIDLPNGCVELSHHNKVYHYCRSEGRLVRAVLSV